MLREISSYRKMSQNTENGLTNSLLYIVCSGFNDNGALWLKYTVWSYLSCYDIHTLTCCSKDVAKSCINTNRFFPLECDRYGSNYHTTHFEYESRDRETCHKHFLISLFRHPQINSILMRCFVDSSNLLTGVLSYCFKSYENICNPYFKSIALERVNNLISKLKCLIVERVQASDFLIISSKLRHLDELRLPYSKINGDKLANAFKHFTRLTTLDMQSSNIQKTKEINAICELKSLKSLILDENFYIQGSKLVSLSRLTNLQLLSLNKCPQIGEPLLFLSCLTTITHLELNMSGINDNSLSTISILNNLEYLDISNNNITDFGLPQLSGLSKLYSLVISLNEIISNVGFLSICRLLNLSTLFVQNISSRNRYIEDICEFKDFEICEEVSNKLNELYSFDVCNTIRLMGTLGRKNTLGACIKRIRS